MKKSKWPHEKGSFVVESFVIVGSLDYDYNL
jgi:hypothetical protein